MLARLCVVHASLKEQFSNECRKTKTKFDANACSRLEARVNVREEVVIGFGFTSDWLGKWREFLSQSLSVVMQNQSKCELLLTLK